ncbi:MAG: antitoxin VapB family protein [Bryobacteraceae bacterium]|nr:antitoxin VapB family protein [Bryobacteraceae bacterium]
MHQNLRHDASINATIKSMGAITLRNMPPEIDLAVRDRAEKDKLSLNQAVIALLSESLQPAKTFHDLDDLFGCLSQEEADEIDAIIEEQSQIEPSDWTDQPGTGWKAPWA